MTDPKEPTPSMNININAQTTPILYTDNVLMSINEDGVVLDICQRVGQSNQAHVVARLGMSHSQAKKLVDKLGNLLMLKGGSSQTAKNVN